MRKREETERAEETMSGEIDVNVLRRVIELGSPATVVAYTFGRILGMDRDEARYFVDTFSSDDINVLVNGLRRIVSGEGTDENINNIVRIVRRYARKRRKRRNC